MYRTPANIPAEARQPCGPGCAPLLPAEVELSTIAEDPRGAFAIHAGALRNGVLCAVRDFVDQWPTMRVQSIGALGGLSVIYEQDAPQAHYIEPCFERFQKTLLQLTETERVERLRLAAAWELRHNKEQAQYDKVLKALASGELASMSVVAGQYFPWPPLE